MILKKQHIAYITGLLLASAVFVMSITHAAAPAVNWQQNLWDRLRSDFSLNHATSQARVVSHKKAFLNNPKMFVEASERAKPYLYYIAQELRKRNLPMEFMLIPVIESAYNPMAVSHAGAAGIWQLMPATARSLGVTQRNGHDGRRDVIASTEAALDYLTYLGQVFKQDWHLVLAAYNAGPGSVQRAMKRNRAAGKPTDFWSLSTLPRETRNYVPKILALANLLKEKPSNFTMPNVPNQPQVNPVKITKTHQLKEIAQLSGVDVKKIQELNPSLKTQTTTQHADELLLPVKEAATLATKLQTTTEVRETIPAVAVNTTPAAPVAKPDVVQPAAVSAVKAATVPAAAPAVVKETVAQPTKTTYKVRKGDTLNLIAKKFGVTVKSLVSWNKLNAKKYLYPGQALAIYNQPKAA